jgi:hypothetical protein
MGISPLRVNNNFPPVTLLLNTENVNPKIPVMIVKEIVFELLIAAHLILFIHSRKKIKV